MNRTLVAMLALGLAAQAGAAGTSKADLAVQSRAILEKHCLKCHGDKSPQSTLKVLDYDHLTRKSDVVRWVDPTRMTASQALELIEEGSMPPGRHAKVPPNEVATLKDWVESGAVKYPTRFDDEFVYKTIQDDVKATPAARVPMARYFSLHHLADKPDVLAQKRREFLDAGLPSLLVPGAPEAKRLDPTETIFRIDLDRAGWSIKPFKEIVNGKVGNRIDANLFDLVLLEYPHAVIPANSVAFDGLVTTFLYSARQVRPVVFVRGDWFVETAGRSPLAEDLRAIIKQHKPVPDGLNTPKPAVELPPLSAAPTADVRIPALDAPPRVGDPPAPKGGVDGFEMETRDEKDVKQTDFRPGQQFKLWFDAKDKKYFADFVYFNTNREVENGSEVQSYAGGKPEPEKLPLGGPLAPDAGDEFVTLFAAPHKFPNGVIWGVPDVGRTIQRFVHPFFPLAKNGGRYVVDTRDAQITRRTIKTRVVVDN
jgi:hypothetical protein